MSWVARRSLVFATAVADVLCTAKRLTLAVAVGAVCRVASEFLLGVAAIDNAANAFLAARHIDSVVVVADVHHPVLGSLMSTEPNAADRLGIFFGAVVVYLAARVGVFIAATAADRGCLTAALSVALPVARVIECIVAAALDVAEVPKPTAAAAVAKRRGKTANLSPVVVAILVADLCDTGNADIAQCPSDDAGLIVV